MEVRVLGGDIASVEADALITAINSGGMWFGGIDGVIQRCAGSMFHEQAAQSELTDGAVVIAHSTDVHNGQFKNVIFVVDDLQQPLRNIVLAGLRAADLAGFKSVTLPTIRMGVMLGVVEKGRFEAIKEIGEAIRQAVADDPVSLENVSFVVYNDPQTEALLRKELTV